MITADNFTRSIAKLRSKLLLTQPFYGKIAMYLRYEFSVDPEIRAYTDGRSIVFGLDFMNKTPPLQLLGVLVHEISHCIYRHSDRLQNRDPKIYNIACDAVINNALFKEGFVLPEDVVRMPQFASPTDTSEYVYTKLLEDAVKVPQNFKYYDLKPFNPDQEDGNELDQIQELPTEIWDAIVRNIATQCKAEGTLPSSMERLAKEPPPSKLNWRRLMAEFLAPTARGEDSWSTPNRRLIQRNIYVPSCKMETSQCLAVVIDVSGSIDDDEIGIFLTELNSLKVLYNPEKVLVFYVSTKIHRMDTFHQDEPVVVDAKGMSGGTHFDPAFLEIAKNHHDVEALIYFTDGFGATKHAAPTYPVIWVTTTRQRPVTDFGFVAFLKDA